VHPDANPSPVFSSPLPTPIPPPPPPPLFPSPRQIPSHPASDPATAPALVREKDGRNGVRTAPEPPAVWATVDGPLGMPLEDAEGHARRFFLWGFACLPFLWAINCCYFWPVLRSSKASSPTAFATILPCKLSRSYSPSRPSSCRSRRSRPVLTIY
jgi:presenilin enhancer 2